MDIPGFKLGRQYADGPYCKGYNALNLSNHKTVNIQIFHPSLLDNAEFVDQFRNFTHRLVGIDFGIMTPTLQAELSSQACYVITEYFPSPQQLASAETNITRQQALHLALQLAHTLDQLHQAGLVHGGIEYSALHFRAPDQIALRPVILQRALPALRSGAIRSLEPGQRRYLAPEAAKVPTPASDFYALGVLLYQLIFDPALYDRSDVEATDKWSFKDEHRDLEPLIRQLIDTDPTYRIQSLDQYSRALRQCGVQLPGSAITLAKAKQSQGRGTDAGKPALHSASKWILLVPGLALVALAGSQFLNFANQAAPDATPSEETFASDTVVPVQDVNEQAPALVEAEPAEVAPTPFSLYQQALTQFELDPETALRNVTLALEQRPNHLEALKLKQRIERELSARSLIARAERQLEELKLLQPSGDNAYESHLALAEMYSAEDERVQRGFTRIAAACHGEAEMLLQGNRLDKAQETVDLGLSVKADYPPLLDLRMRIEERRSALERKQNLARNKLQQREQQKRQQMARQQEAQQQLLKQQRQDDLMRQQEEETRARKVAELAIRQEAEKIKRVKVETLLRSANGRLKNNDLSLVNVFSAHQEFEQLRNLDYTDPNVRQLQQDLIDAYTILALRENNDEVYKLAISALEQGVQLNPRDLKKLQIRSQLSR